MKFILNLPEYMTTDDLVEQVELLEDMGQKRGFGFEQFQSTYRTLQAYKHVGLGIVVKKQNCILEPRTPAFVRVPTIHLKNGWVVQPLVKKTKLRSAVNYLAARLALCRESKIYPDLHVGNVGWYNGQPVMFDW